MAWALQKAVSYPTPDAERVDLAAGRASIPTLRNTAATRLTAPFTMPASGADEVAQVGMSGSFMDGQVVFLSPVGYCTIMNRA